MKILSIGNDRNIFSQGSEVRRRAIDYGKLVSELHIIVFTPLSYKLKAKSYKLSNNVWLYPTNSRSRWWYIFDAIRIGKKLKGSFDIVTVQDPYETGLVGRRLAKYYKCTLQLQIHVDIFSPHFKSESFKAWMRVFLSKAALKSADCVRVVSSRVARSVEKYTKAKITILPIFVDASEIKKGSGEEIKKEYAGKKIILMVSRLAIEKNIPLAIEVMGLAVLKHPNSMLIIVGDGSDRGLIERKISKVGLIKRVVILENIKRSELASYYKAADVFLHTSNYEGYGMVLAEAAANELPIVTTDVGIAGDIEGAKVVSVGNKEALAEELGKELENPQKTKPFNVGSYEEYLNNIKKSWEICL